MRVPSIFTRIAALATCLVAFETGWIWAQSTCADVNGTAGYSRIENHAPSPFDDTCIRQVNSACYECWAWDRDFHDWVHCTENVDGSYGSCGVYDSWDRIPPAI